MTSHRFSPAFLLLLAQGLLYGQTAERAILERVEPEYAAGKLVPDPARIEMVVDAQGVPFSLASTNSLPHNVVEALAKWRFAPGKPIAMVLRMEIKRPLGGYLEKFRRPVTPVPPHLSTATVAAKLSAVAGGSRDAFASGGLAGQKSARCAHPRFGASSHLTAVGTTTRS